MSEPEKTKTVLKKGQTGDLDEIFHIQGILPNGSWDWIDNNPDTDRYVMLKTVTIKMIITVKE